VIKGIGIAAILLIAASIADQQLSYGRYTDAIRGAPTNSAFVSLVRLSWRPLSLQALRSATKLISHPPVRTW
jgi:hypothetical protein